MEFLEAFAVFFLLIFAAAMLAFLLYNALRSGCAERFDVYVKSAENLEQFIICAEKSSYIGEIYIISEGANSDKELSEKYKNVKIVGKTDW